MIDPISHLGTALAERLFIMKTLTSLAALASLSVLGCFAIGCSASANEDVASGEQHATAGVLLYQHDAAVKLETVSAREADRLLIKLFESGYRGAMEDCQKEMPDPRIVPEVQGKVTGSFTGIGKRESLYIVSVWGCDASHAEGYGTTKFVVTEPVAASGDIKVLANVEEQGAGVSINRIADVDGDGQNELVMTSGWSGQGYTFENIDVVRFAGNNLAKDEAFGTFREELAKGNDAESPFYSDNCGVGDGEMKVTFANIYTSKQDGKPAYTAQKGSKACPAE